MAPDGGNYINPGPISENREPSRLEKLEMMVSDMKEGFKQEIANIKKELGI